MKMCSFLKQLTAGELEIINLLSRGYTNSAIAETLYIDTNTVEDHLNNMYSKLKADANFNDNHPRFLGEDDGGGAHATE